MRKEGLFRKIITFRKYYFKNILNIYIYYIIIKCPEQVLITLITIIAKMQK